MSATPSIKRLESTTRGSSGNEGVPADPQVRFSDRGLSMLTNSSIRVGGFQIFASLLAFSVLFLAGCASNSPSSYDPNMEVAGLDSDAAMGQEVMGQEEVAPLVLSSLAEQGLGIELRSNGAEADLVIRSQEDALNYEIERLYEPARLKIRIPNVSVANLPEKVMQPENQQLVESINYRAIDNGSEVELLIANNQRIGYESEPIAGNLYVRLMPEGEMADISAAASEEAVFEKSARTELPAVELNRMVSTRPVLKGLRFENVASLGQVVVADMESAGIFSLKKTAPSEYVLRLEKATFDENAIQTLMAPPTSTGIRTVRVVRDGQDTLVRVFANPTLQLEASPKNGGIVIRPSDAYLASTGDIRAQAELEEAADNGDLEDGGVADDTAAEAGAGDLGELENEISQLLDEAPKYTGRKISLDLQDTDIDNALRIIAEVSNLNIIASDDVQGKVTLRLIDVPWDQALDVILKTNALDKVLEGNVMRIAPIEKLRQEREALKQAREAEEELEPLVVRYIRISYAKASEMRP
ncbi:MAG: secretin and TonB N-terminal domain-containing protein, partial [Bdellovibrionales bacterium]|nr:secretin and TonB N-terminal domain-containing protein [Bdellovibrionales bacterium]